MSAGTTVDCGSTVTITSACVATQADVTKEKQRTISVKRKRFNNKIPCNLATIMKPRTIF
jgi:hypothetical protein